MEPGNENKPLSGFAKMGDDIVGKMIFGSIGRAGFYVVKMPIVGTALTYAGKNIAEGYNSAHDCDLRKKIANEIVSMAAAGTPYSAETIRSRMKDCEIPLSAMDDVKALVQKKSGDKKSPFPTPQIATA